MLNSSSYASSSASSRKRGRSTPPSPSSEFDDDSFFLSARSIEIFARTESLSLSLYPLIGESIEQKRQKISHTKQSESKAFEKVFSEPSPPPASPSCSESNAFEKVFSEPSPPPASPSCSESIALIESKNSKSGLRLLGSFTVSKQENIESKSWVRELIDSGRYVFQIDLIAHANHLDPDQLIKVYSRPRSAYSIPSEKQLKALNTLFSFLG